MPKVEENLGNAGPAQEYRRAYGLYSRVAGRLGVSRMVVARVAAGRTTSARISAALRSEVESIWATDHADHAAVAGWRAVEKELYEEIETLRSRNTELEATAQHYSMKCALARLGADYIPLHIIIARRIGRWLGKRAAARRRG